VPFVVPFVVPTFFDQMDVPDPKRNQYFKLTDDQTRNIQEFLKGYLQGLQPGEKLESTIDTLLSATQNEYPELRLSRRTFARKIGSILESHKKDAGLPIRGERQSKDYRTLLVQRRHFSTSSIPYRLRRNSNLFYSTTF
jgi:hypothetical protein